MIRILVPGQPVAKGRPKITTIGGKPRAYTPEKTVRYENLVALAGAKVMDGRELLEGPLRLTIFAHFQLPKKVSKERRAKAAAGQDWHTSRPDGDNVLKAVGDALNGIVWRDDAQIAHPEIIKLYREIPELVIEVRPLP
jgi:Holliday junction resolvase RusA-like endonuclease